MTDGWLRRRSDTSFPGGGLIIPSRRNTGAPFPLPPGNLGGAKLCLCKMRETAATPSNEHTVCPKLFDTVPTGHRGAPLGGGIAGCARARGHVDRF